MPGVDPAGEQLDVRFGVAATVIFVGNVSVNAPPDAETNAVALLMVKVSLLTAPWTMLAVSNALVNVGIAAGVIANIPDAGPELPKLDVTSAVVIVVLPASAVITLNEKPQLAPAAREFAAKLRPPAIDKKLPPAQSLTTLLAGASEIPAGKTKLEASVSADTNEPELSTFSVTRVPSPCKTVLGANASVTNGAGAAVTVNAADPNVPPVPNEVTKGVGILLCTPVLRPRTFTAIVQVAPAATMPPDSATELAAAVAVNVPPHPLTTPGVGATAMF